MSALVRQERSKTLPLRVSGSIVEGTSTIPGQAQYDELLPQKDNSIQGSHVNQRVTSLSSQNFCWPAFKVLFPLTQ
jgi:hypothetical protein